MYCDFMRSGLLWNSDVFEMDRVQLFVVSQ